MKYKKIEYNEYNMFPKNSQNNDLTLKMSVQIKQSHYLKNRCPILIITNKIDPKFLVQFVSVAKSCHFPS